MRIALFAYSKKGIETGRRIKAALGGEFFCYTAQRLAGAEFLPIPKPSAPLYEAAFRQSDALVFVSSCGIAVRSIAPYIKSKTSDPAVVAVDELGRFSIALLSGHIGGANALAETIAGAIGAAPVITTATDANGRFSVDSWAKRSGWHISDMAAAKRVSAAVLEEEVPLKSDFDVKGRLPNGIVPGTGGRVGIYLTYGTGTPFECTLRLVPKCLCLGIGCRRGTKRESIENAVRTVLTENGIDPNAVASAASIDLKADEEGLLGFCRSFGIPIRFYSSEELNAAEGDFTPSEFVKSITGVDNVCERAAVLGAEKLIVKKTALCGVTVAVGLKKTEVSFE